MLSGRRRLTEASGTARDVENFHTYQWIGLRTGRYKYVRWITTCHQELYDLLRDPYELTNIANQHPKLDARFRAQAEALQGS